MFCPSTKNTCIIQAFLSGNTKTPCAVVPGAPNYEPCISLFILQFLINNERAKKKRNSILLLLALPVLLFLARGSQRDNCLLCSLPLSIALGGSIMTIYYHPSTRRRRRRNRIEWNSWWHGTPIIQSDLAGGKYKLLLSSWLHLHGTY